MMIILMNIVMIKRVNDQCINYQYYHLKIKILDFVSPPFVVLIKMTISYGEEDRGGNFDYQVGMKREGARKIKI